MKIQIMAISFLLICSAFLYSGAKKNILNQDKEIIKNQSIENAYNEWRLGNYENSKAIYVFNLEKTNDKKTEIEIKKSLASIEKQLGNYQKSIEIYKSILETEPSADIYEKLGTLYYYTFNYDFALFNLEKSIAINPLSLNANLNLGKTYLETKSFEKAIFYFEQAIKINENFTLAYYYLAQGFKLKGETKKAIENYENCLKKDFYFLEARTELLELYLDSNEYENTYKQINRIRTVDPFNEKSNLAFEKIKKQVKKQEEIIKKTKKETGFIWFKQSSLNDKAPSIKVGINTNSKGEPIRTDLVSFKCNSDFIFKENGEFLANGLKNTKYLISLKNNYLKVLNDAKPIIKSAKNIEVIALDKDQSSFIIDSVTSGKDTPIYSKNDNQYRGNLSFTAIQDTIKIINTVNIEEYCYSVISSEILYWWPLESLKAQAVLIRNHAFYKKEHNSSHKIFGYDVCDSQHCQVYRGVGTEKPNMNEAVDATIGKVLVSKNSGDLINGFFHSNSGGYTQGSFNVYGWSRVDYLQDAFEGYNNEKDPNSPYEIENWIKLSEKNKNVFSNEPLLKTSYSTFRWTRVIFPSYIEAKIKQINNENIGKIKDIIVLKRSKSGHVNKVLIKGELKNIILEKENIIRNSLGLGPLRSTMFWVEKKMDKNNNVQEFIFYGGGWGHGIGMSQTGAASMALKGYSYDEILKFYYKNSKIKTRDY